MKRKVGVAAAIAVLVAVLGFVFPRYALVQPSATITVFDSARRPIKDARVVLVAASYPHRIFHHRSNSTTDANGMASFASMREWEIASVMLPHGVNVYFRIWCVEHAGYRVQSGEVDRADQLETLRVELDRAEHPTACDGEGGIEWKRLLVSGS